MLSLTTRPASAAVGFLWEGTYEQAAEGEIAEMIATLQERMGEIVGVSDPSTLIGLSWTGERPDGFRYFIGLAVLPEAARAETVPAGMAALALPGLRYATVPHESGDVGDSYRALFEQMAAQGFEPHDAVVNHREEYPADLDPFAPPRLRLLVPVGSL